MARKSREPEPPKLDLTAFREVPAETGMSLDQLGAALADLIDRGADPYAGGRAPGNEPLSDGPAEISRESADDLVDDSCEVSPKSILEAMLFVGSPDNQPLASKQVAALMRGVRAAEIDALVRELNDDYQSRKCPYTIVTEAAGYRLILRDEFARVRDQFYGKARQARLSQAAIEVLAAVAYHAPITADEISRLRGRPCGAILSQLVRRQLLRWERGQAKSRQARYFTTPRFLELFGLERLEDLPRSPDLEEAPEA